MKIPFDIKYRPEIESGKYKVQTRDGQNVRIICWDARISSTPSKKNKNLICLHEEPDGTESIMHHFSNGKVFFDECKADLVIVIPEPELTEFEQEVRVCVTKNLTTHIKDGNGGEMSSTVFIDDDTAKKMAAELLSLARKELCEQIVDHTKEAYKNGKAEALKDLPMWERATCELFGTASYVRFVNSQHTIAYVESKINKGDWFIRVADLVKLPGFKEDEK